MEGRSLTDVVMGVRPIDHPPEPLVESSPAVILGGFLILAGVLILAAFMWAARGRSEDGQPDPFGKMIKVHEVAAEYHTSWSPGAFWPSKETHGKSAEEGHGSPIFKVVWRFLLAWLAMSGFFLVLAGAIPAIEVFRQEDHVRSAGCASSGGGVVPARRGVGPERPVVALVPFGCVVGFCRAWSVSRLSGALGVRDATSVPGRPPPTPVSHGW